MLQRRVASISMLSRRVSAIFLAGLSLLLLGSTPDRETPEIQATILAYHVVQSPIDTIYSVEREKFQEQMRYLAMTGFNVIPLADLLDYVEGRRESLPPNPVVITVDDGWRCTYTEIYPELKKLGFPFTVFIYPKFIQKMKNTYALSWAEVKKMAEDGVDIQSHSFSHPFLTHRRNALLSEDDYLSWLETELTRSKQAIEKATGKPVRFLAYPYGDYDSRVAGATAAAGYEAALTCDYGVVRKGSNPFRMKRVSIFKNTSFATFRRYLGSGRLQLDHVAPAPGRVFDPQHPVIEARIENFDQLDPESVGMSVLSLGPTPYFYNPEDGSISLVVRGKLSGNEQRVVVWGADRETGRRVEAAWNFYLDDQTDEEPAVAGDSKPPARPAPRSGAEGQRRR